MANEGIDLTNPDPDKTIEEVDKEEEENNFGNDFNDLNRPNRSDINNPIDFIPDPIRENNDYPPGQSATTQASLAVRNEVIEKFKEFASIPKMSPDIDIFVNKYKQV